MLQKEFVLGWVIFRKTFRKWLWGGRQKAEGRRRDFQNCASLFWDHCMGHLASSTHIGQSQLYFTDFSITFIRNKILMPAFWQSRSDIGLACRIAWSKGYFGWKEGKSSQCLGSMEETCFTRHAKNMVGPRLRELSPSGQRELGGRIHAT